MKNNPLPRLDISPTIRQALLPFCRLKTGEIWEDTQTGHKVGCLDAASAEQVEYLMNEKKATLAIHDPPYNLVAFDERPLHKFIEWCQKWIQNTEKILLHNSSLYIWLGADQNNSFQPLPDFMIMMRNMPFHSRSFITMRNQRGYGTQKNWMAIRQELLYYINVEAEYTDIPKILRGYYKEVNGQVTENFQRSKSENIRAGNVWVDIQQVFYRMEENVSGCYAQKPIRSIDRIVRASSAEKDIIVDFFSHSGTTLLSAEINKRKCFAMDIDPLFCEITIRRLEHFRHTGYLGWQNGHPFEKEYNCPQQNDLTEIEEVRPKMRSAQPSLF
jgi:DNA modification methylase